MSSTSGQSGGRLVVLVQSLGIFTSPGPDIQVSRYTKYWPDIFLDTLTYQHCEAISEHIESLVYRGGSCPLIWREPLAGDEGRGGHDGHPGDPVKDGADVTTEVINP